MTNADCKRKITRTQDTSILFIRTLSDFGVAEIVSKCPSKSLSVLYSSITSSEQLKAK